jgi:hypothetical protein
VRDRIDTVLAATGVRSVVVDAPPPPPAPTAAPVVVSDPSPAPALAAPIAPPGKQPRSAGAFWAIRILSFFTFGIGGVVAGLVGLASPATKSQGRTIIILSVIWFFVLIAWTAGSTDTQY